MGAWQEGWGGDAEQARYAHMLAQVDELKRELRERARIVAGRERELEAMRAELARRLEETGGRKGAPVAGERELAVAIAAAEQREREAAAERALAQAERERLDERERRIHEVERELAGRRVRLEQERAAPAAPTAPEDTVEIPPPTASTRRR